MREFYRVPFYIALICYIIRSSLKDVGVTMDLIKAGETLDDLQLKGIHIIQKEKAFRFGVDAVLLANFPVINKAVTVLDLCTGNGIVPLIVAGKTVASHITGIEIQQDIAEMAQRSVDYNKLEDKIKIIQGDLTNIELIKSLPKVDIVTVNPPYKVKNSGIINLNDKSAIARHEICCTLEDVIKASALALKDSGKLYMVHRPERLADIFTLMRKYKIEPKRARMVYPAVGKAPNIVLVEGQKNGGAFLKWENSIYVYDQDGNFSKEIDIIYGRDQ